MQINLSSLVPYSYNKNFETLAPLEGERWRGGIKNFSNLAPLKADTVSFGAKKSEFQGIDLLVVNKFKAPVEKFKTNDDFQKWCSEKIEKDYLNKEYKGRQEETTIQRKAMLKEWSDYVKYENDAYNNAISLLILDGITKNLKPDNDTLPPVLNKGILADTISEIQNKTKTNPKAQIDFNKLYQTKLKEQYSVELSTDSEEESGNTGWIVIPSRENDPNNFEANVEKLKALSHDSWCTKSFNAEPYLSQGDFHVYLENGKPKLGVRFVGEKIQEIQGEKNNSKIPLKYLDIVKSHIKNEKLTINAKNEIESAENIQIKLDELQQKLAKPFNECTSEELFSAFNMLEKVDEDGMLILKEYKQPDEDFSWEDIGIKENKLFKYIKEELQVKQNKIEEIIRNYSRIKQSDQPKQGEKPCFGWFCI